MADRTNMSSSAATLRTSGLPASACTWAWLLLTAGLALVPLRWVAIPAALVLILVWPGYALGRVLGFEDRGLLSWVIRVGLSVSLLPLGLDIFWRASHDRLVLVGGLVLWAGVLVAFPVNTSVQHKPLEPISRRHGWLLCGVVLWLGAAIFFSHWPAEWRDAPLAASPRDFVKHHAVMLSLERSSLPLESVYYANPEGGPYYYYHYFYLLPGALRMITGNLIGIPFAFGLIAAVVAGLVVVLTYILARVLTGDARSGLIAAAVVGLVGGWDILPAAARWLVEGTATVQLDAWAPLPWRIHNLITLMLWGPQHVHGLVTLLVTLWLLVRGHLTWQWIALVPLLAGSLFGSSVYLAMVVFPGVGGWLIFEWIRSKWERSVRVKFMLGGLAALVLCALVMWPQARGYLAMQERLGTTLTFQTERHPWSLLGRVAPSGLAANLLDLPQILLIELGVYFLVLIGMGRDGWRWIASRAQLRILAWASVMGILGFLSLRSGVHQYDYGFKIGLLPAFILMAMAVGRWASQSWGPTGTGERISVRGPTEPRGAWAWKVMIVLGCALGAPVGLYEAPAMAIRRFIEPNPLAADARAIRFISQQLPAYAVVQVDPGAEMRSERMLTLQLLNRRSGVMFPENAEVNVFRPVDMGRFRLDYADLEAAVSGWSAQTCAATLHRLHVTHVMVGDLEKTLWQPLEKFEDRQYFEAVFRDGGTVVYRVLDQGES